MYFQGSKHPFCSPQCASTYYQSYSTQQGNPNNRPKSPSKGIFPTFDVPNNYEKKISNFNNFNQRENKWEPSKDLTDSFILVVFSQNESRSPVSNNLFTTPKIQNKPLHQFGKTSTLDLLKFYEKSPKNSFSKSPSSMFH